MPATSLFGCRLRQLATDNTPFYFLIAVVQVVWLFIYWIGIVAFSRPETCKPGTRSAPQQWVVTFVLLALFLAQAAACVAATLLTCRGTPLEPSKRRWVPYLSYAFLASLPVNAGLVAYADWVVEAGDGSCWSSGSKSMPASIMFGAIGALAGQLIGMVVSYSQLSDVERGVTWHALTRTGLSSVVGLVGSWGAEHRGPPAALEAMATQLQRLMGPVQADKTDAAAAVICAKLLQEEAAAAAAAPTQVAQANGHMRSEGSGGGNGAKPAMCRLESWAQGVCRDAGAAVLPPAPGVQATCTDAEVALHWARYAAAAYGIRQHMWRRGKQSSCGARRRLSALAAAARADGAAPLLGWGPPACDGAAQQPSRADWRGYAAAKQLLGSACQLLALSPGDRKRGLLPHLLAIDRGKQAVVLAIAGHWEQLPLVPPVQPLPAGWTGGASTAAAEAGLSATGADCHEQNGMSGWVHSDSLKAADALLQLLERGGVLRQLLQPSAVQPAADARLAALGCAGWRLLLAGHGLGAGAAALLALRLQPWHLGPVEVWAFGPPAQLCSPGLAAAISSCCALTSVVVGYDLVPRASSAALAGLVEQSLVGLARLRYSKFALLAAVVVEALGPRAWRGCWVRPGRALRPLSQVPAEAWGYLQRYRDWQQQQQQLEVSCLPGRVLSLYRGAEQVKHMAATAAGNLGSGSTAGSATSSSGSSSGNGSDASADTAVVWQAAWVEGKTIAAQGIRVSRHAASDHYVSRLLSVLETVSQGRTRTA